VTFPRFGRQLAALGLSFLGLTAGVVAHPHIFIDAKVAVVFDDAGHVSGLRHDWTFDSAFSAWMVQGLDTNGDGETSSDELQELADENMIGLADYGFYTYAGAANAPMQFSPLGDQQMVFENGRTTLSYSLTGQAPQPVRGPFELAVYDPEYYVAITVADGADVSLENAPESCAVQVEPPKPMDPAVEERLYALGPEVLELPPDLAAAMRGTQGLIVVNCDGVVPPAASALDAVNQVAQARPATPFGGPPPEIGLPMPRTGFFGWLQNQQRQFYGALTGALEELQTDWTAFWVLGGLSFLYGVFHAAGPGHGKVVISSYVLANERQLRRGVLLSVASAMLQSLVAVGFVVVAAGLLGLSSMAMGEAARWVEIVSYALVVLLGLWLIARKAFGWDHAHGHQPDMTERARAHLHAGQDHHHSHSHSHDHHHHDHDHHDHIHVVTPEAAEGGWREQLAVVFAVGLRPCSGALVVLVFALSQGLLPAGIAAVFLMGVGTAITVALLATVAVMAKGLAARVGGLDTPLAGSVVWWLELLGACAVLGFGTVLLIASL
jgi:nickel/cobalt exporter